MPRTRLKMDIHCVTRWSKADMEWEGVAVRSLLEAGLVKPWLPPALCCRQQNLVSGANLPLEVVLAENFPAGTHYDACRSRRSMVSRCAAWWAPYRAKRP